MRFGVGRLGALPALLRVPARFWRVCLLGSTPSVREKSWLAISMVEV